jgi:hypothetical protein
MTRKKTKAMLAADRALIEAYDAANETPDKSKAYRVVFEETATHRTTTNIDAPNEKIARLRVLNGKGDEISDKVTDWGNDRRILSCEEIKAAPKKVFVYEEASDGYNLTWRDGDKESCIHTTYPMHVTLVKRLLLEAGYKEVSLQEWSQK